MALNWDDMRYFLALCRKNSFVAAANELRVTHSTVARRITTLEESMQTLLFHRNEKGCTLTPAGEKLIAFAEQMESTVINLEESVSGYNKQLSGSIRIGAPDGIGNCYLAACLGRLQVIHSSLDIELVAVPMYYSLSKREIDILITVKKPTVGKVIVRKLTDYRLGMFASREYLDSTTPIKEKTDLKKHKIAVASNEPQMLQAWREIGFNAVPLSSNDMLSGLQSGMVDAYYAPPLISASFQWFSLAPNMCSL